MDERVIDVILTTRNRLGLLKRTLARIYEHTRHPYRLHVVDDASDEGNVDLLVGEWRAGRVHHLYLRGERCGTMANSNLGAWAALSDPVVFTDDDVLCPGGIEPCWLGRLVAAMDAMPDLGLLALNHPGARRNSYAQQGPVTFCKYVGGTFQAIRRAVLEGYTLPHGRDNFKHATTQFRSQQARRMGWKVGYLTETFCYHAGRESANGTEYKGRFVEPEDWLTLRPAERWVWRPPPGAEADA